MYFFELVDPACSCQDVKGGHLWCKTVFELLCMLSINRDMLYCPHT